MLPKVGAPSLVALSQLGCMATLAALLSPWSSSHNVLLDGAFIFALIAFAVAASAIARAIKGPPRLVFWSFAGIALLLGLVWLYGEAAPGPAFLDGLRGASKLEKAIIVASLNALLPLYGGYMLGSTPRTAEALERSIDEERALSATLEQAVASRTVELDEAQHVLKRMWWLGQQITLELDSQRVLERFLEAAVDIAHADGGAVGLIGEGAKIRFVVGTGLGLEFTGLEVPVAGSAMGRVIRSGQPWNVADVAAHRGEVDESSLSLIEGSVRGLAIVPISRRGERIGAVVIGSSQARFLSTLELERVEAMADLLSVALENAELVETLRQAEWRFRTLFRAAPDAVLTVLQSGRIREANDAVREITGCDPLQVLGKEVTDLVVEHDRAEMKNALDAAFAGTPTRLEVSTVHAGTGARHVVALATSRLPEADPPSVLLVGRDMTSEREMRMRLMESDRLAAVGELVAGVAHEVNNPLSSISAFAQILLRDGGLTAAQREAIDVIKSETARASQVVRDLLAFARRSDPQREPIDLNNVIARTLRLRGYQLTANNVEVEQVLATDIPAVLGDARQIQQVCLNLVTNAIQAMATVGGGRLTVTTRAAPRDVILEIRDTGPGIPEAARAHIFEPFFTTKQEGEGTGLGLSVSYGIITAHGGSVAVVETSARGTTFRVALPAAETQAHDAAGPQVGIGSLRSPLSGIRLLFVDRDAALRSDAESYGVRRGISVLTTDDGLKALDLIRTTGIDAVVCDLWMAGIDGMTFHERLRKERPGLAAHMVFLSGDAGPSGRSAATRQPVVAKPVAFDRLEEALVAVMRGTPYLVPSPHPLPGRSPS